MLEAGATPEAIAKVMVQQELLNVIGKSPEDLSKQLLKQLRSGEDISLENLNLNSFFVCVWNCIFGSFKLFFPVEKLIFGHFWNGKKWNLAQKFFREIDLFDFMSFFDCTLLSFWPTVKYLVHT